MDGQPGEQSQYADNAVRAIQNKRQVPEIDFTLHTMEDGSTVSTQERVCKGTRYDVLAGHLRWLLRRHITTCSQRVSHFGYVKLTVP